MPLHPPPPLPPMHQAVLRDDVDAIRRLLQDASDADGELLLESRDVYSRTPLYLAAKKRRSAAMLALLAAGADTRARNEHGRTPLHAAASHAFEEGVLSLLAAGADRAARDRSGKKPRHVAHVSLRPLLASSADEEEDGA